MFSVFDFKTWPDKETEAAEFREFGDESVEKLVQLYGGLLTEEEKENASDQWLSLKNHISQNLKRPVLPTYESVLGLDEDDQSAFSAMLPLVNIMLTISPSTAECERGFSAMNALKSQYRTSLKQESLSNLMRIKVDGPPVKDFNPNESVVTWLNSGKGTRHTKGHVLTGPRGPRTRQDSPDSDEN